MDQPIAIFVNMESGLQNGAKEAQIKDLKKIFKHHGAQAKIFKIFDIDKIPNLIKKLGKEGYKTFVAAGGDGTVNALAAAMAHSSLILGVLPMGTLNNFAKTLHIPLDMEKAVKNLLEGKIQKIDVAEVNGKFFVNNSSIGIYPGMVRKRKKEQKNGKHKLLAYIIAAFHVFQRYPLLTLRLTVDNVELTRTTPIVFVGNNIYKLEKKFDLGIRERLDQNVLSVFLTKKVGRLEFMRLFFSTLFGTIYREKKFDFFATQELRIDGKKTVLNVVTDGEVKTMPTPLHYKIHPEALHVIVPPSL